VVSKRCTRCGEEKPLEAFARDGRATDGTRSACRVCCGTYNRQWNRENRKRCNAATVAWRARNPEKVAAHKRAWRLANPEKVRKHKRSEYDRHMEAIIYRVSEWRKLNPEKRRAQSQLRRARLARAAGVDYTTPEKLSARIAYYGSRCYYCGGEAGTLDHRIPLARGGSHFPANFVPACVSCNASKNDRTEREYLTLRDS